MGFKISALVGHSLDSAAKYHLCGGLLEIGFRISVDKMSMLETFAMSFRIALVLTPIVMWIELKNATKQTAQGDFGDVAGKGVEK